MASKKISALDAAASATATMEVPVNDSGMNKRLTLQKIRDLFATFFSTQYVAQFTHSTSEQTWPFEKWINGETIYVRTWNLGDADATLYKPLTGLTVAGVGRIHSMLIRYAQGASDREIIQGDGFLYEGDTYYETLHYPDTADYFITVWYTKP